MEHASLFVDIENELSFVVCRGVRENLKKKDGRLLSMSIPRHEVAACTVCVEEGRVSGREKGRMGAQSTWLGWYIKGAQRRTRIHSMNV